MEVDNLDDGMFSQPTSVHRCTCSRIAGTQDTVYSEAQNDPERFSREKGVRMDTTGG
jgi:hypothetical protein